MYKANETYFSLREITGDGQSSVEKYKTKYQHVADYWQEQSAWHTFCIMKDSSIWIDSEEEFQKAEFETKKAKALEKLTPEEKQILGLV